MFGLRGLRRRRLKARPFPPEWLTILERNVPYYHHLPAADQRELQQHIQVFLAEKRFEGCAGLEISDDIKVTIAAQACILQLHREADYYPGLLSIVVYPSSYVAPVNHVGAGGVVTPGVQVRLGESWSRDCVVLSWDDVKQGATDLYDGHNVVFHEFAHQLDRAAGSPKGAPILPQQSMYIAWARVLGASFKALRKAARRGWPTLLDKYGATNPAEFFAVATECFFEKPHALKRLHPELYEQLRLFYQQDPAKHQESTGDSTD